MQSTHKILNIYKICTTYTKHIQHMQNRYKLYTNIYKIPTKYKQDIQNREKISPLTIKTLTKVCCG